MKYFFVGYYGINDQNEPCFGNFGIKDYTWPSQDEMIKLGQKANHVEVKVILSITELPSEAEYNTMFENS